MSEGTKNYTEQDSKYYVIEPETRDGTTIVDGRTAQQAALKVARNFDPAPSEDQANERVVRVRQIGKERVHKFDAWCWQAENRSDASWDSESVKQANVSHRGSDRMTADLEAVQEYDVDDLPSHLNEIDLSLHAEDPQLRKTALDLVSEYAEETVEDIAALMPGVICCLSHADGIVVRDATSVTARIAEKNPDLARKTLQPLIENPLSRDDVPPAAWGIAAQTLEKIEPAVQTELEEIVTALAEVLSLQQTPVLGLVHPGKAARALTGVGFELPEYLLPVADTVVDHWDTPEPEYQPEGLGVLGQILSIDSSRGDAVKEIEKALSHESAQVRRSACSTIQDAPGRFDADVLQTMADEDPDSDVREEAADALQEVRLAATENHTPASGSTEQEFDVYVDTVSVPTDEQIITLDDETVPTYIYSSAHREELDNPSEEADSVTAALIGVLSDTDPEPWRLADAVTVFDNSKSIKSPAESESADDGSNSMDQGATDSYTAPQTNTDTPTNTDRLLQNPIPDVADSSVGEIPIEYNDLNIGDPIGSGGFAEVYEAVFPKEDSEQLAIKTSQRSGTLDKQTIETFEKEAKTWEQVSDRSHVVDVVAWGLTPEPWIAMEYMDHGDLHERLEKEEIDVAEALWIGSVLAETVANIHNLGIRHFDIKPRNVLFRSTPDGNWPVPKIGDWGLARLQLEHSGSMEALSVNYAAPEQFDSEEFGDVDHRTDIYQLACVLYEALTGTPPFDGNQYTVLQEILGQTEPIPPSEANPDVPASIDEPILKAISTHKQNRHDHMLYFRDQIRGVFEEYDLRE